MKTRQCSLGGRSFTDILSNAVFLAPLKTATELQALLRHHLDGQKLTLLMHEAVHHQSLNSPLGYAWCLLGFGYQRSGWAMNETQGEPRFINQFAQRYIRFLTTTTALRPLAEGLALFAEYDVVPSTGTGPQSLVMTIATIVGASFYPEPMRQSLLETKLFMSRMAHTASKKADLLAEPMTAAKGGYLTGYSFLKSLWRCAMQHDEFFAEADNFLLFAMGVLYGDPGLVSIILSGEEDTVIAHHALAAEIVARALKVMTEFFDDGRLAARREQALKTPQPKPTVTLPIDSESSFVLAGSSLASMYCTEAEIDRADALLKQWIGWQRHGEPSVGAQFQQGLSGRQEVMWNGRKYLRLIAIDVMWEMGETTVLLRGESFTFDAVVAGFTPDGDPKGEGSLEIIFDLAAPSYIVLLIGRGAVGLVTQYSSPLSPAEIDSVFKTYHSSKEVRIRDEELSLWTEDTREQVLSKDVWRRIETEVLQASTEQYLSALGRFVTSSRAEEFQRATALTGLLEVFKKSTAIGELAVCSVLASTRPTVERFLQSAQSYGISLEMIQTLNREYSLQFRLNVVDLSNSHVFVRF